MLEYFKWTGLKIFLVTVTYIYMIIWYYIDKYSMFAIWPIDQIEIKHQYHHPPHLE